MSYTLQYPLQTSTFTSGFPSATRPGPPSTILLPQPSCLPYVCTSAYNEPIQSPVVFQSSASSHVGVSMAALLRLGPHMQPTNPPLRLIGHDDYAMSLTKTGSINLYITWPGYKNIYWERHIVLDKPNVTRGQLGAIVADYFARFILENIYITPADTNWTFGPTGINFKDLHLISLYNVATNAWQAEVNFSCL